MVMDSDAHFDLLIGEFDRARDLLEKLDFPEELVLNRSADSIRKIPFEKLDASSSVSDKGQMDTIFSPNVCG